jgi:hypothetical protein
VVSAAVLLVHEEVRRMGETYYRTLPARRWDDVPEALRMTMDDVRRLTYGHIYRSLDHYLRLSRIKHQCAAAIEAFDIGRHVGDATRHLGKYRPCHASAQHGKAMCRQHRHLERAPQ